MAEFLHNIYGIELLDAYAIAWAGVSDTKAYQENDLLEIWKDSEGNKSYYPKNYSSFIATQYVAKIKGKSLCNP